MYRDKTILKKNEIDSLNTGISTGLPCYSPTPREPSIVLMSHHHHLRLMSCFLHGVGRVYMSMHILKKNMVLKEKITNNIHNPFSE